MKSPKIIKTAIQFAALGLCLNSAATAASYTFELDRYDSATAVNGSDINSNFWLIGAYNPNFDKGTSYTAGNDYLKLTELTVSSLPAAPTIPTMSSVPAPAPASLGLIALALAGLGIRRKFRV